MIILIIAIICITIVGIVAMICECIIRYNSIDLKIVQGCNEALNKRNKKH